MSKLIIVSNRLPVHVARRGSSISFHPSVGGVATGMSSVSGEREQLWFGWPGIPSDTLNDASKKEIADGLAQRGCRPVFLSAKQVQEFYSGFSNKTIWPLFHYFTQYAIFEQRFWNAYKRVNQHFCDEVVEHVEEGDNIWVHDYHLMLLPQMLRQKMPGAHIGFFLHIPFPSFEMMRYLPWRAEILEGLLGADLVGFHEYDYVRHFLSSVYRICGYEHHLSELFVHNRLIRVDAFPMGIDYSKYAESRNVPEVAEELSRIKQAGKVRIIASIDRLDYTKGILNRLEAYDWFLTKCPEYRGKVNMVVVAVPSRTKVEHYGNLRENMERLIARINGTYGSLDWSPVSYMYRSLPFNELAALYNAADVALITPLRDGMNLIAKEFVATQDGKEHQGMLILSEMAGAAGELVEAIIVNPHDKDKVVSAIKEALEMPQDERRRRNALMQSRLRRYNVSRWASDFIRSLSEVAARQVELRTKRFGPEAEAQTTAAYRAADNRLLLLDYDGTLVPFAQMPQAAAPGERVLSVIAKLAENPKNEVVIVSGRDRETLTNWVGSLPVSIIAEHGAFKRSRDGQWETTVPADNKWMKAIRPVLELYVDRTPGSFVEEKSFSLVWHCRKSDPDLAKLRTQELKGALVSMTTNLGVGVFEGSRIVEVKHVHINKGRAARSFLAERAWPFVFCAGDDYTDEDMFSALPEEAISCKIGVGPSNAKYRLNSSQQLLNFLARLVEEE